jgi:hypothetical protein
LPVGEGEAGTLGISLAERGAPWMKHVGLVETGDPRSSQSIDDLVSDHKD